MRLGWRGKLRSIVLVSWYFRDAEKMHYIGNHAQWSQYALVSLGLTLVNIIMIWISSIIIFRMKEVLPIEKKVFWSDLGIARKTYRGKAILAHQAFDPEVSERPELGRKRSLWGMVRGALQNINTKEASADQTVSLFRLIICSLFV